MIYLLMRKQDRVQALFADRGSIIIFHEAGNMQFKLVNATVSGDK